MFDYCTVREILRHMSAAEYNGHYYIHFASVRDMSRFCIARLTTDDAAS